jgi:micrococcal nuclease
MKSACLLSRTILLGALLAQSCHVERRQGSRTTAAAPEPVTEIAPGSWLVQRVVDGDTLVVASGERIRLAGIDAPESKHPSKPVQCLSEEASTFLAGLVDGKQIRCQVDSQGRDRYGRLLCHVFVGTAYVNRILVEEGLAIVYRARRSNRHLELLGAEEQARSRGKGVWGRDCSYSPML